jgi:prepilin-type N-terminal cleavage/methylation domain-containing protein
MSKEMKRPMSQMTTSTTLNSRSAAAGFSLLELVIVCAIVSVIAALSLASFANRDQAGRFMADVAARIRERRASAVRINALIEPTLLENFRQPPISIDFSNLSTTAPLVVEGVEGAERTSFGAPPSLGGTGQWNFVYQGTSLQVPSGWRIAASASQLSPIPLIPLGTPTTTLSFTADGKLDPSSLPSATSNINPDVESPFPAIYLTNGSAARAVAVHPSGLVELWQYDEKTRTWNGFSNRSVTTTPTPTPVPTPTPTPTPGPCSIGASPSPLLIPKNGSGTVTVTLWSFSGTGTITAKGNTGAHITVSPLTQQVTDSTPATFSVDVMTSNGSINFSSPCGSTNVSVKTF